MSWGLAYGLAYDKHPEYKVALAQNLRVVWQRLMDMRLRCAIVVQLRTQMWRWGSLTRQGKHRSQCQQQRK